jgi:hypothetical protein
MRSDNWLAELDKTITQDWPNVRMIKLPDPPPPWDAPTTEMPEQETDRSRVLREALELVAELWPKPASATVVLETHTWLKLRRTLLAVPDLVADAEKQDS